MSIYRLDLPGVPYHVFARGNNKQAIFHDKRDRQMYFALLRKAHKKFAFRLFSYVLMDNHVHLLLQMEKEARLSSLMHWVQLGYARYYNDRYGHVGHIFQSRYHSILIDKENYFLTVDRYIHLNPVRAGMVPKPEDFTWSSYRSRLGLKADEFLDHETILAYFGMDLIQRQRDYRAFTDSGMNKPEEWPHDILRKTSYLGSREFIERIHTQKNQSGAPLKQV